MKNFTINKGAPCSLESIQAAYPILSEGHIQAIENLPIGGAVKVLNLVVLRIS